MQSRCPRLYATPNPLYRRTNEHIEVAAIEEIFKAQNSPTSEQALLVRNIVTNLLLTDASVTPVVSTSTSPTGTYSY